MILFQDKNPANSDQVRVILDCVKKGPPSFYEAFKESLIETNQGFIVTNILKKGNTELIAQNHFIYNHFKQRYDQKNYSCQGIHLRGLYMFGSR